MNTGNTDPLFLVVISDMINGLSCEVFHEMEDGIRASIKHIWHPQPALSTIGKVTAAPKTLDRYLDKADGGKLLLLAAEQETPACTSVSRSRWDTSNSSMTITAIIAQTIGALRVQMSTCRDNEQRWIKAVLSQLSKLVSNN